MTTHPTGTPRPATQDVARATGRGRVLSADGRTTPMTGLPATEHPVVDVRGADPSTDRPTTPTTRGADGHTAPATGRRADARAADRRVGPGRVLRAVAGAVGVAVFALAVAGCGIRTTSVPVDAGPAPSRMPCSLSGKETATRAQPGGVPVRVYLVCASALVAVDRTAPGPEDAEADRLPVARARALLDQLLAEPSVAEREAGFTTDVGGPLVVSSGWKGDPEGTLRLTRQPEDLTPTALAQIVCTFAESEAATAGGTVVLGGPGDYAPRGYRCSQAAKQRPETPLPTAAATGS
ncbi:hypothetical protein [Streptomyces sp. NPDC000410]|uniref:hypothetical protein n=1 Tax=Streptomyces sp. NPDC000410 TaxID=3154254 RepID=UPI0033238C06